jgi:hypothetical protein
VKRAVRKLIFIFDASQEYSPSIVAAAFCMSCFLYWHLKLWLIPTSSDCKWLVQFGGGGEHSLSIFQSSGISWMCSTLVNVEQDFCFGPPSGDPFAQETPQKWPKSSTNWNLLCIWWGVFYISEAVVFVVLAGFEWM